MNLYDVLARLKINYEEIEHEAVYTVKEAQAISRQISGVGCKNLFLKDSTNTYYLVIMQEDKRANFKELSHLLNTTNLSFASEDELYNLLKLTKGSLTPFGIINDEKHLTTLIIDKDLKDQLLLFHPNTNTKTISLSFADLIRFIDDQKNKYILM